MPEDLTIAVITNSYLSALSKSIEFAEEHWGITFKLCVYSTKIRSQLKIKNRFLDHFTLIPNKPDDLTYKKIKNDLLTKQLKFCLLFYTRLIPECIFKTVNVINFHPSLLPRHPGLRGYEEAIIDKQLGFTAHYVDKSVDLGIILRQFKIEPFPIQSPKELKKTSSFLCSVIILSILSDLPKIIPTKLQKFANVFDCLDSVLIKRSG